MASNASAVPPGNVFPDNEGWVQERRESVATELRDLADAGEGGTNPTVSVAEKLIARAKEYSHQADYRLEAILATEDVVAAWSTDQDVNELFTTDGKSAFLAELSALYGGFDEYLYSSGPAGLDVLAGLRRAIELGKEANKLAPIPDHDENRLVKWAIETSFIWEQIFLLSNDKAALDAAIAELDLVSPRVQGEALATAQAHATALQLKTAEGNVRFVLDIPFNFLTLEPVSLSNIAPARFRFVDARSLAEGDSLRVVEMSELPKKRYVAISYVWRAPPPPPGTVIGPTMSILGANNADPISVEVLRDICRAALKLGSSLIWLDGLCIKQSDDADKAWQIQRMYSIYQHCRECVILPAGLSRLGQLDEQTTWVHRAWTLQEAVAPEKCQVLFAWTRGDAHLQTVTAAWVSVVTPGRAAMTELYSLLSIHVRGEYQIMGPDYTLSKEVYPLRLIVSGENSQIHLLALLGAIDLRGEEGMIPAIWRAAVMRTAYNPVDMVLSMMGIMGVNLDPSRYASHDRTRALVDLMRALVGRGDQASWLALIPSIPPGSDLTTLPIIPETSATGEGLIVVDDGKEIRAGDLTPNPPWWLKDAPTGMIDDEGFLHVRCPTVSVAPANKPEKKEEEEGEGDEDPFNPKNPELFEDYRGRWWTMLPERREDKGPWAMRVGYKQAYMSGALPMWIDPWSKVVMLVDKTAEDKYRVLGYAGVLEVVEGLPGWEDMTVRVK